MISSFVKLLLIFLISDVCAPEVIRLVKGEDLITYHSAGTKMKEIAFSRHMQKESASITLTRDQIESANNNVAVLRGIFMSVITDEIEQYELKGYTLTSYGNQNYVKKAVCLMYIRQSKTLVATFVSKTAQLEALINSMVL